MVHEEALIPASTLSRVALATLAVLLVVFGTFRIGPIDNPVHLAAGRWIWEHGQPMTTNALSWSWPDYPNVQQYPLYQVVLHLLKETFGFAALSLFCAASWFAAASTWAGWAGGIDRLLRTVPIWFLAVIGIQRHLVARPEVFTLLGLGVLLVLFERWRANPSARGPLVGMVVTIWVMLNCHQMYVIGVMLLAGFAVHVAVTRALADRGLVDATDADLPLTPLLVTLGAGIGVTALGPVGFRAWLAPVELVSTVLTLGSDGGTGAQSAELEPIWTDPLGGPITLVLLGAVAIAGYRARGRVSVLELGVLAMGLGLVAIALRGIPFFALAAASVITRWHHKTPEPLFEARSPVPPAVTLAVLVVALGILGGQLRPRDYVYLQRQQGLGRSVGDWGDAVTGFLREHPPPGEVMNIGWVGANYLIYGVYPVRGVFVDGRWESYPKPFLTRTIAAESDQTVLDGLIEEYAPGAVVAELRDADQLERFATLLQRDWTLVFADSVLAVAVADTPDTAAYRAAHGTTCGAVDLPDWRPEHRILHAQQQIRFASLLRACGATGRADAYVLEARAQADHPAVQRDLASFDDY